jgi:nucleoside-diphosphate-sugar epimerase
VSTLITGSSGLVGQALVQELARRGHKSLRAAARRPQAGLPPDVEPITLPALQGNADFGTVLAGASTVVHTAARVHVMRDAALDPLKAFREVNTAGTLSLARQAALAGVRRFVFVSSVKVNGEATEPGHAFHHDDIPRPMDPYGISKAEAEHGLRELATETGMAVVVVRPPLVYGPGVKANFATMMRAVQRGIPLPLACTAHNRRSLIALDNLVDLLIICLDHPAAANQIFLASDGEDLSTADLLKRLGQAMGRPARLWPVPNNLVRLGATMLGKGNEAQRLLGNLQIDIAHTRKTLGWTPPITVDEGLKRAVAALPAP